MISCMRWSTGTTLTPLRTSFVHEYMPVSVLGAGLEVHNGRLAANTPHRNNALRTILSSDRFFTATFVQGLRRDPKPSRTAFCSPDTHPAGPAIPQSVLTDATMTCAHSIYSSTPHPQHVPPSTKGVQPSTASNSCSHATWLRPVLAALRTPGCSSWPAAQQSGTAAQQDPSPPPSTARDAPRHRLHCSYVCPPLTTPVTPHEYA